MRWPLAYRITSPKVGDNEVLPELVDQSKSNLHSGRMRTLAYDKAADDGKVHQKLHAEGIHPVIQNRTLWKGDTEQMLPGHDGNSNIVYDEAGTVYCFDRVSQPMVRHPMAYIGHEPTRGTLKYRCPALHEGWTCPMSGVCNAGKTYGLTVRVKQAIDLRRFPFHSARHETIRATLQRPPECGTGQRAVEDILGRRRRQRHRPRAFPRSGGYGDDRARGLCHGAGEPATARGNARQDAVESDRSGFGRPDSRSGASRDAAAASRRKRAARSQPRLFR